MAISWYNMAILGIDMEVNRMPEIIPIRDLKNTNEISQLCHSKTEPIFITKNGYGDMVIMSMETFERRSALYDIFAKLDEAEQDRAEGRVKDARTALEELRQRHGI
jgi:PHD/YefM family antitoxin component YafN of YafNO toxin-antitoxin module